MWPAQMLVSFHRYLLFTKLNKTDSDSWNCGQVMNENVGQMQTCSKYPNVISISIMMSNNAVVATRYTHHSSSGSPGSQY